MLTFRHGFAAEVLPQAAVTLGNKQKARRCLFCRNQGVIRNEASTKERFHRTKKEDARHFSRSRPQLRWESSLSRLLWTAWCCISSRWMNIHTHHGHSLHLRGFALANLSKRGRDVQAYFMRTFRCQESFCQSPSRCFPLLLCCFDCRCEGV